MNSLTQRVEAIPHITHVLAPSIPIRWNVLCCPCLAYYWVDGSFVVLPRATFPYLNKSEKKIVSFKNMAVLERKLYCLAHID